MTSISSLKLNILALFITLLLSPAAFSSYRTVPWKATYYQTVPNKSGISQQYCDEHLLGNVVHIVNRALVSDVMSDRGIKLNHGTFHIREQHGIYFINGDFFATKTTGNQSWQDHIYYHLYKLTEYGTTRGAWSSGECKGLYTADVINAT